jgi:hypothetical protein
VCSLEFDQGYFPEERIDRKKQRKLTTLAKYVDHLCAGEALRIFEYSKSYKLCEHVGECSCNAGYLGTLSVTSGVTQETSQSFRFACVSIVGLIVYINKIGISKYVAKNIIEVPINCY